MSHYDIAMIGLGVMGRSLALNLLDHQFNVVGYDISASHREKALHEANLLNKGKYFSADDLTAVLRSLNSPRIIALSVPAGTIVDQVINELIEHGLTSEDIVIDTGNSHWQDTERREHHYHNKLQFFSTAVSGGEQGARHGPSMMASGNQSAWVHIKPMWEAIAAKVDDCGQPISAFSSGEPCAAYLGPAGSGHYVKMVHNGIEYADMQLICEAYHYLSQVLMMSATEISAVFTRWNQGMLNSYLLEISADILATKDPETGTPLVEVILDKAQQKGTGLWTAINALEQGNPATCIAQAVFSRAQSGQKLMREAASQRYGSSISHIESSDRALKITQLESSLYCAKLVAYAQGFDLMRTKSIQEGWQLDFSQIAKIWRSGCIIRAGFLHHIALAYQQTPQLDNLLFADYFQKQLQHHLMNWRQIVADSALSGLPMPGISTALQYFDTLRCDVLPANLLQAQRDYFGSHTYSRIDQPEQKKYHLTWSEQPRHQQAIPS